MTYQEWKTEAISKFGEDPKDWKFVCPVCKYAQSIGDFEEQTKLTREEIERVIGFSCIGRWLDPSPPESKKSKGGPCNYAGGGLFRLNPVKIELEGETHQLFAFG